MKQDETGIILDYLKEHNMTLAVHNWELAVKDMGAMQDGFMVKFPKLIRRQRKS